LRLDNKVFTNYLTFFSESLHNHVLGLGKIKVMKKFIVALLALVYFTDFQAQRVQTDNYNIWFSYNGDHKFSQKLGVHLEYQERRNSWGANNQQHLIRTALNYHFLPNCFASLGSAFVQTYPYGKFPVKADFPEFRIYQQLQYSNNFWRFESVLRFRLEQRWSYLPILKDGNYVHNSKATYTNRIRVFQRFSFPLNNTEIIDKTLYISTYDEIFINFGKNVSYNIFDQNRAYLGLGYKVPKLGRVELGYMNQLLLKSDGIKLENNHTMMVSLASNIPFMAK
jgi:hypothetical protein